MSTIFRHLSKESLAGEKEPQTGFAAKKGAVSRKSSLGTRFLIVLSFIFSLTAFMGAYFIFQELLVERKAKETMEAEQVQFRDKAKSLEDQLATYEKEAGKLAERMESLSAERYAFKKLVDEQRSQLMTLQRQFQKASEELSRLKKAATQAPKPAGSALPSSTPVVSSSAVQIVAEKSAGPKKPQVLTLNRKFNFAVINLGIKDQMKVGDVLIAERKGVISGRLKVEKLYENFSAAAIQNENANAPIAEGDALKKAA